MAMRRSAGPPFKWATDLLRQTKRGVRVNISLAQEYQQTTYPKYWEFRSSMFAYERFSRHAVAAASMRRG
jgi:hypothetical protein